MFSKKSKTKKDKKATKKEKNEEKKRLKREKREKSKEKKDRKKKEKKNKAKHKRMKSYQEYNIEEHIQPINFNPELRFSQTENTSPNKKSKNPMHINTNLKSKTKKKSKHTQSHSTPTMPAKEAIFEGIEDEYSYNDTLNGYKPPEIMTKVMITNNQSRTSRSDKYMDDDMDDMVKQHNLKQNMLNGGYGVTPISQQTNNTNHTRISHSNNTQTRESRDNTGNTMISRSTSHSYTRSSNSRSSVTASVSASSSCNLNLMDTINHISKHASSEHNNSISMVLNLGNKSGRRLSMEMELENMNRSNSSPKPRMTHRKKRTPQGSKTSLELSHNLLPRRTSAILGTGRALLPSNARKHHGHESGASVNLALNSIISSQKKYKKELKYRPRHSNSGSMSRVLNHTGTDSPISTSVSRRKPYTHKQIDQYGHKLILSSPTSPKNKKKKVTSLGSTSFRNKKKKKNVSFGGGYGNDIVGGGYDDSSTAIPTHLRAYYAIQSDLEKLKTATKKKSNRTQLDAINSKLHTLFFANERTNIANLAAFQKFFIDRMSVKSVHKDLDWHICLLRPKIHSRLQDAQIDNVITVVADLLRKCVKKFNNKRGHLTSASNTHRIGVGTYGGGKDKNAIQSAYILSSGPNKLPSSVPPEFYKNSGGSRSVLSRSAMDLRNHGHARTPSGSLNVDYLGINDDILNEPYLSGTQSPYEASDSEHSVASLHLGGMGRNVLTTYDVMTPPASVQLKQDIKKEKKEKQKAKHKRLLSFSTKRKRHKNKNESRPNMSMQEVVALTGLPGMKKVKGSDHHNVDEPYPMELFHVSDMDFVLVYYVKFLTKFEALMCEFLSLYQRYCALSHSADDIVSDVVLSLSLVASNPRETYMESMLKAHNTMLYGRQSREHPWIRVQTDKRKSQKFGQDLIYMVKYMKSNDISALHELMKQAPDLNTRDRESGKTVLQIALDKSISQPSFAFIARYLALKQLLFSQRLQDEAIIIRSLQTNNPMVAEILLHLSPDLTDLKCLDLALHNNHRNLARYMLKLNLPTWHNQQLIRRWHSACEIGDVVKLRSVLQRGFNINYFDDKQKTAFIICVEKQHTECVQFLLKNHCNVNAQDMYQKTALHYAAIQLNGELFRLILEHGANWTLRDLQHKTPIKYVMEKIGFVPRKRASNQTVIPLNNTLLSIKQQTFRNGAVSNTDHNSARNSLFTTHRMKSNDMYTQKKDRFWKPVGFYDEDNDGEIEDNDDDDDDSWDEYGYLVDVIGESDDDDVERNGSHKKLLYQDIDVQQVVKIVDIACQACIPLDSRLLLLAVQRDWPHVILVLCQNNQKHVNIDIIDKKDGTTPLMLAAREGKKACLSAILQSAKPDLDRADSADRTPIMHAAYRGESECVERLIKAGASIDVETVDGTTLLMAACYGGLDDFAKYLIKNGADLDAVNENGFSALLFASSEGYQDTVSLLLNGNASIAVVSRAGLTPLMAGCSGGLHELVLYVLARINRSDMDESDENGWTALMHAVASGSEKCAAILLKAGASVITLGEDGYSLLSIAIMGNLIWMVRHILDCIKKLLLNNTSNKKNKNIYNMFNSREHSNGFSCIHEAAGIGANKCLQILLEYNEKYFYNNMILFDLPDLNGRTPLMIAALNGHLKCVQLLLNDESAIININKCDNEGNSTLIYAIESNNVEIVKLLCTNKIHSKKFNQKTINLAKNIAKQRKQSHMMKMLDSIGLTQHSSVSYSNSSRSQSQSHSHHTVQDEDDDDEYDEYE